MAVEEITPQQLESEIVRREDIAIIDVRPTLDVDRCQIDSNGLPFLNVPESSIAEDVAKANTFYNFTSKDFSSEVDAH